MLTDKEIIRTCTKKLEHEERSASQAWKIYTDVDLFSKKDIFGHLGKKSIWQKPKTATLHIRKMNDSISIHLKTTFLPSDYVISFTDTYTVSISL